MNAGEAELIDYTQPSGSPSPFPLMKCRNIYVLPGIPKLLREKWKVCPPRGLVVAPDVWGCKWLAGIHGNAENGVVYVG